MRITPHRQPASLCGPLAPVLLLTFGCGDVGGGGTGPMLGTESAGSDSPTVNEGADETMSGSATETMGPATNDASDTAPGTGDTASGTGDTEPGGSGVEPVLLYKGPISAGVVPDWDPDNPRPVLVYRYVEAESSADSWTLGPVPVAVDGTLAYDADVPVNVWGWEQPPPLLYEGSSAEGVIPDWSFQDPTPVVSLMAEADDTWQTAMFVIYADGSIDSFTQQSPRLLLWGWPLGTPGVPAVRYQGLVGGSEIPGWDPMAFRPVLLMTRDPGGDEWASFLVTINDLGQIIGNIPNEALVWGW